jgi:hypothetical protein
MSTDIVQSLADRFVAANWSIAKLRRHLLAAQDGHPQAVATAIDKGFTLEELCEGIRKAIMIQISVLIKE